MNSLLLDIARQLKQNLKVQEGLKEIGRASCRERV